MNIGILGLGTVGCGVVNTLIKNQQTLNRRTGTNINILQIAVQNLDKERNCDISKIKLTRNPFNVINNNQIDVIVELMGGVSLTKELIIRALNNKKHVVTANKALIATHGDELIKLAKKNNVCLLFEAAVAAGTPIIKALEQGLSANKVDLLAGIINGTGNFILTEMRNNSAKFEDVLKQAQDLGYAELDPTFDVEGIDAAHKLTILSSMAFGCKLRFDKVSTIGISKITNIDVSFADELGFRIKHLGIAKKINNKIETRVHPTLIPKERLLANVDGVMNAVVVHGNIVGPTLYYGAGAGAEATASAVIANLIDIIKNTNSNDLLGWNSLQEFEYLDNDDIESIFYLRLLANKASTLAQITKILTKHGIDVKQTTQKNNKDNVNIAIITNKTKVININFAVKEINKLATIEEDVKLIHVETLKK